MSWNIKIIGPRAAVKAAVLEVQNMPEGIKQGIVAVLDEPVVRVYPQFYSSVPQPLIYNDHARVEGHGHSGGGGGSIGKLEVELIGLLPATSEPKPAEPTTVAEVVAAQTAAD